MLDLGDRPKGVISLHLGVSRALWRDIPAPQRQAVSRQGRFPCGPGHPPTAVGAISPGSVTPSTPSAYVAVCPHHSTGPTVFFNTTMNCHEWYHELPSLCLLCLWHGADSRAHFEPLDLETGWSNPGKERFW